jgi:hypothetical protein
VGGAVPGILFGFVLEETHKYAPWNWLYWDTDVATLWAAIGAFVLGGAVFAWHLFSEGRRGAIDQASIADHPLGLPAGLVDRCRFYDKKAIASATLLPKVWKSNVAYWHI